MKDQDLDIQYYPGKANVVVDALSRKSSGNLAYMLSTQQQLINDLGQLEIEVTTHHHAGIFAAFVAQPTIIDEVKMTQLQDDYLKNIF